MSAIRLNGTSSGYTELAPPAAAGSNTITLPSSNGSANQFLKNGSTAGTLGWSSMVEDSSGNIGVGASSPDAKLKVHGASGTNVFAAQSTGGNGVLVAPYDNNPIYHLAYAANSTAYAIGSQSNIPTLLFTGNAERARITSGGYFKASNDGTYYNSSGTEHEVRNTADATGLFQSSTHATFTQVGHRINVHRSASSAYAFGVYTSGNLGDTEFNFRGDGQAYADQSWNGGGADYAEYFEWEDGNPDAEDRRGYPVALVGNKIKIAEDGDTIIGIVSAAPVVLGDAAWNHWSGKYLKDEFGGYLLDEKGDRQLNPDYDPTQPYVPREDRPEWSPIGLMGKLRLRKGQPVAANWLKLRDISATVEEWLVR